MDLFVARQPIFDRDRRLVGYELLYRENRDRENASPGDGEVARSPKVVADAVLGIGLRRLTEGLPAFINVDRTMLVEGTVELLEPGRVVLELLETVEPDAEVVEAVDHFSGQGFRFALDDFEYRDEAVPLLRRAEIVKIDVLGREEGEIEETVDQLVPFEVRLLAERVESEELHELCTELGFDLFQGFHYLHPEIVVRRDLPASSATMLKLLNLLRDLNVPDREIEEVFRTDPALSYKLLKMVNSAALGGRGIQSLGHAVRLLGREPLYRWISLLLVSSRGETGRVEGEIVKSALLRGRFSELIGDSLGVGSDGRLPTPGSLFITGLFSRLDALLSVPMGEILSSVDLTDDIEGALLGRAGLGGRVLNAVEAYEEGEWHRAEEEIWALNGDPAELPDFYLEALSWASKHLGLYQE